MLREPEFLVLFSPLKWIKKGFFGCMTDTRDLGSRNQRDKGYNSIGEYRRRKRRNDNKYWKEILGK